MNTEVLRDLRERDLRITLLRDTNHVVTELLGKRLGHDDILPGQPSGASHLRCHLSVQQSQPPDWEWTLHKPHPTWRFSSSTRLAATNLLAGYS